MYIQFSPSPTDGRGGTPEPNPINLANPCF